MSPVPTSLPVTNSSITGGKQKHSTNMANSNAVNNKQQMEQNNNKNNNNSNNTSNTNNIGKKQTTKAAHEQKQIKEMPTAAANTITTLKSSASASATTTALTTCSKTLTTTTTAAASSTTMNAAAVKNVTTTNATTSHCDSSSISSSSSSSVSISDCQQSCDAIIKTELESLDSASDNAAETLDDDLADSNDLQLAAMRQRPITLSSVNPHIICSLCFGYLIDATTIVECLHSFCHSCLIKHLRTEQYCPRCEMMINTAKPNIKPDTTLQAIVYKLVPGLYEKELMRKRAFYKDRPEEAALATPEQRGDDTEHLIFSPSDYMSISLEYADIEEHMKSNVEYNELLKPRYLKCPAMCTVAHLKKFVFGKFEINNNRFIIDIMYKVKTIVLLDHYTLMDVAYIYTWKRDAPMRFYFRVKQSLKPLIRVKKNLVTKTKKEITPAPTVEETKLHSKAMCIVHEPTPSLAAAEASATTNSGGAKILEPEEIKQENESEVSSTTEIPSTCAANGRKQFEIIQPPSSPSLSSHDTTLTDKLKITLVHKTVKDKADASNSFSSPCTKAKTVKEKKENHKTSTTNNATHHTQMPKDERKVENIKLKIDLSKQNSVTIINMSDPERKEIVKPVKPEKEWKVKTKKEKDGSPKSSPKSSPHSERKSKTPSPLTVPPLTIKAERISPLAKINSPTAACCEEDDKKSQFLKSFALTPIKSIKMEKVDTKPVKSCFKEFTHSIVNKTFTKDPLQPTAAASSSSSKRKSKEPMKTVVKKPKLSPPLATEDFKIKLPPINNNTQSQSSSTTTTTAPATTTTSSSSISHSSSTNNSKILMPPPAPVTTMKPPATLPKKLHKPNHQTKLTAAAPGSLTPHPMHTGNNNNGIQLAAPGSRTPIAKRFQPILPKTPRVNPFANIPSDVNKLLKDAGTEIKSIPKEPLVTAKVYGPKTDSSSSSSLMGPPAMPAPAANHKTQAATQASNAPRNHTTATTGSAGGGGNKTNSYLNLALFNATKSKGNEVPPGCRTPMYTPNSPIYSPSSPQYVPNYNIPTMPTYKYTPKPSGSGNSYLQSVLAGNNQMSSSLFPSPPVKKDASSNNNSTTPANNTLTTRNEQPKRVYPFARSPSPVEDPPEKQLKVKCLLNSCNINIPSSLSITITREDGETSANGAAYPKHKSPVNNYIEILKLPDQTQADNNENKRLSPPIQNTNTSSNNSNNSLFPNPPIRRVATPPPPPPTNTTAAAVPTNAKQGSMTSPTTGGKQAAPATATNITPNMNLINKQNTNNGQNKSPTMPANKPATTPTTNNKSPVTANDKKTPSPEKRLNSTLNDQKSPSSSSSQSDNSAGKKFRHILPRQIVKNTTNDAGATATATTTTAAAATSTTNNNTPKPCINAGNVIGTYSSPNGVNVKIHSNNKKVQTAKKSPGQQAAAAANNNGILNKNFQQSAQTTAANATQHNGLKASGGKSPQTVKNNCKTSAAATANSQQILNTNCAAANKLSPPAASNITNLATAMPPALTHPMQAMLPPHLAAAGQAELGKFLKENLLRAQVQAAVANQSNMFYPYAANAAAAAAQLGQFNPTMYNYQQAYIMDQLSRMQRAGTEAFSEYMQKLKNSMEANKTTNETLHVQQQQQQQHAKPSPPASSMPLAKNLASPKATGQSINNNNSSSITAAGTSPGVATTAASSGKDQQQLQQHHQHNQMTKTK